MSDTTKGMTLKDATSRFCPMIYQGSLMEGRGEGSLCMGVDCMMWRWKGYSDTLGNSSNKGYCGLAGQPNH